MEQQPRLDNEQQPRLDDEQQPRLDDEHQPRLDDEQQPRLDDEQQPRLDDEQQPRLEHEQHGPAVHHGANVGHHPPLQPHDLEAFVVIPVEEGVHNVIDSTNQTDLTERSLRLPQPTVEGFSYLPSHYEKHPFEASENEEADRIARTVQEMFTQDVVDPRLRIDAELKRFKELTKQGDSGALPACFVEWKNMIVKDNFILQQEQQEVFRVECNDSNVVKTIAVTSERDTLTPEVNAITDQMKDLLTACHSFLSEQENINQRLIEQKEELQKIHVQTLKTNKTLETIESLPLEVNAQCAQVNNLLHDIKAAVSSKHLTAHRVKQTTGVIRLLPRTDAR